MSDRTRIDRVVEGALARAAGERAAFLDAACDGDVALRREVESLLAEASSAQSFLEEPASAPSLIGQAIGPYRIDALIGAGGMGEVYRARDARLGRDVAIKILPAFMSQDPNRLARLGREARALAALSHPNIAAIYGLEETDGLRGLVLELVDGETLADRIARGALPIDEALRIAAQIAEALAVAHAKGIVHRDLKPANVKITTTGIVKVLDFGLAKTDADAPEATTLVTRAGTVMGTPAYMSPEQARGEAVDQQADIWAFGCVLYEMLTARRAFAGRTVSDSIAAVLKVEPDGSAVPAKTPAAVRTLLARCLAKDRARRLHSIADARIELEGALDSTRPESTFMPPARSLGTRRPAWQKWSLAAALGLIVGVGGYAYGRSGAVTPAPATYSVELDWPEGFKPWAGLAISPDGKAIAASIARSIRGDGQHIVVRHLDQLNGWQRLNGGDGGEYPFWSPDGRHLAFFVEGKLLRMDPPNGAPVVICDVLKGRGGVWLEDGTIVFSAIQGPLMSVDAQGGRAPAVFVPIEEGLQSLRYPVVAGPGRLLYLAQHVDDSRSELRSVSVDAPERPTTVVQTSKSGIYERGYLFYDRNGIIIRQRFDPSTSRLQGEPVRLTSDAVSSGHIGYLPLAANGDHMAVATIPQPLNQLVWIARDGRHLGEIGEAIDQQGLDLSPDGRRLAIARRLPGQTESNVWIVDTQSVVSRRLTAGPNEYAPVWAPDGLRLAYTWTVGLSNKLYKVNVEGPPTLTPLAERESSIATIGWAPDGRFIWSIPESTADTDLGKLGIFVTGGRAGSREPAVPFRVGLSVGSGRVSPDGRHIAFVSNKTGRPEVYLDTFPTPAAQPDQVSRNGGRWPRWARNGRELYFIEGNDLVVVAVSPEATPRLRVQTRLFRVPEPNQFAVSPDGSKFIVLEQRTSPLSSLKLTLNWSSPLRANDASPR